MESEEYMNRKQQEAEAEVSIFILIITTTIIIIIIITIVVARVTSRVGRLLTCITIGHKAIHDCLISQLNWQHSILEAIVVEYVCKGR